MMDVREAGEYILEVYMQWVYGDAKEFVGLGRYPVHLWVGEGPVGLARFGALCEPSMHRR